MPKKELKFSVGVDRAKQRESALEQLRDWDVFLVER